MRRLVFLLVFGLGGAGVLVSLGVWQMQRLDWKQAIIADIETRIAADPGALPASIEPTRDSYLPVEVTGVLGAEHLRVLVSRKGAGAGYRIIRPLIRAEDRLMVDMGFVPTAGADALQPDTTTEQRIIGNLQWPQESDRFTPAPDLENNIWFARDVPAMAQALGTRSVLVVRREATGPDGDVQPMPVDTSAIPNDHLQYAITWFSLAAIWSAMTVYFLRRGSAANKS